VKLANEGERQRNASIKPPNLPEASGHRDFAGEMFQTAVIFDRSAKTANKIGILDFKSG
jgi:hypothetical protein